ncbi:MAG: molecular chaperone TorD family protein [Nitrospinae bacterium]|nr:molecular chaperone TorD family protein [Nitrospinota bacterium]
MTKTETAAKDIALAKADLYRFLSTAFEYLDREKMESLDFLAGDIEAVLDLLPYDIKKEYSEFQGAINSADVEPLKFEYSELFLTRMICTPYENGYGGLRFDKVNILADISGFYKAFGFTLSDKAAVMPDHIAVEMEFLSSLALKEAYAIDQGMDENLDICVTARKKFLAEHIGPWAGVFCRNLEERTTFDFYKKLALLTAKAIDEELKSYGIVVEVEGVKELPKEPEEAITCPSEIAPPSDVAEAPLEI